MKKVLTIAGSDCSGGAGIEADIKTITAHKMYAMSAITALTAQNTTGVYGVFENSPEFLAKQLDCIFTDIFPDAEKIGMVSNVSLIEVIIQKLQEHQATNIVIDPVMVSTSGKKLLQDNAADMLIHQLLPIATLITPNIPEAEVLSGIPIANTKDMEASAYKIAQTCQCSVLIKGGHLTDTADDLLYIKDKFYWFHGKRINNFNTHGTGCTLSSALACNLAAGLDLPCSVQNAKNFLSGALQAGLDLGKGNGPLNHCFNL